MTATLWFLLMVVVTWACGRAAKLWPKLPKGLVPWLVLAIGYVAGFCLAMHHGATVAAAAEQALAGLAAGLVAVGGHEALKPLLAHIVGAELATKLLGKLPPEGN